MTPQKATKSRNHTEYTVGWVCALPKEQTAATAMLDQRHTGLPKPPNDPNTYTLGSIGKHNIVIACLPKGQIGNNSAANVAAWMVSTFPSIKVGLMVGIGGGIPSKVRLGDVVVSTPVLQFPGVVQLDFGKTQDGGKFERTGSLNNPPSALLTALTKLETEHDLNGSKVPRYLEELKEKWPRLAPKYLRTDSLEDVLFRPDYSHVSDSVMNCEVSTNFDNESDEEEACKLCDRSKTLMRRPRDMRVHYGLIASGNQVIKDAKFRDNLKAHLGGQVLCVEMEAAGLMNNFPCIVIRGICDYADSHKNKVWQEHAAATAAAFAKELLGYVQPSDVDNERTAKDILDEVHQMKRKLSEVDEHVQDGFKKTKCALESIQGGTELQMQNKIFEWLTPVDYRPQQSDYFNRRQQGTGQWLLDSAEYQIWLNLQKQTLFCPGIPGAGKTILTSIVVADLATRFQQDPTIGIAYIYCNFRQSHQQKVDNMLSNLLKQLSQCQPSLPECIKNLYDQHNRSRPSLVEILSALHSVAAMFARVFIIVDALDECQASDGCRSQFLSEMLILQQNFEVNIFVTSRFILQVTEMFIGYPSLEIRACDNDVHKYVEGRIAASGRKFLKPLQDEIKVEMTEAVDGMFLLAQLLFDSIETKATRHKVESALKNLPKGLNAYSDVYRDCMERINSQAEDFRKLANDVLSWIVCTKRPLTTFELQHALAIEFDTNQFNKYNIPAIEDIVSVCAGLITIDVESGTVRLVHYTTQEYFEQSQAQWFPSAQLEIARSCITYMSYDIFESGLCRTDKEFEKRLALYKLYDYAARNWGHHAREASTLPKEVISFLMCKEKMEASSQALITDKWMHNSSYYSLLGPKKLSGVHLAAYFGLSDALISLLLNGHYPEQRDTYGQTALSWAAKKGHCAVVKLLLDTGWVNVDSKDSYGRTPLWKAAGGGCEDIVKLLLSTGRVDVDVKDSNGRTPLWEAAKNGYEAIVKLLDDTGRVNVDSRDSCCQTPLSIAAQRGHEDVVELLLTTGRVDVDSKDSCRRTPLWNAVYCGNEIIVQLLLDTGRVDVDSKDSSGRTPLQNAAGLGNEDIVELLLDTNRVDVDSKDCKGETALSIAAKSGHEVIVELLMDTGLVDVDSKDSSDRTPLWKAAERGNEDIVKLLLETGPVDVDSKDCKGETALSIAAKSGHEAIVELLMDTGLVDVDSKDSFGRTPMWKAAERGNEVIVKLLLNTDRVDADSKDSLGLTPLLWAARYEHEAMMKLLLDTGRVETDLKDSLGLTPLLWAARHGNKAMTKLLLDTGRVNVDSKDHSGTTPLSKAVKNRHESIVRLLLDTGRVDLNSVDCLGGTPLLWAVLYGHEAVVKLFLDADGTDVNWKDPNGYPLLFKALRYERWAIIKMLLNHSQVDLKLKDSRGRTALSTAAEMGYEAAVMKLLDTGRVDVDSRDCYGWTSLSRAAYNGHDAIVKLLLDTGLVDVDSKDSDGLTPLSKAKARRHEAVMKLLLNYNKGNAQVKEHES